MRVFFCRFGSDHCWYTELYVATALVNRGRGRTTSSGLSTVIIWVWGRFWWRESCWWRWTTPGWASATAASSQTFWCAALVAPTPSSASQSSRLPDAWTGWESASEGRRIQCEVSSWKGIINHTMYSLHWDSQADFECNWSYTAHLWSEWDTQSGGEIEHKH